MQHDLSLSEMKKHWHGTLKSYLAGFMGSLALTILSFFLVHTKALAGNALIYAIAGLAVLQTICQLIFFLHVGQEAKPRWESLIFGFMIIILLIVVGGSLWIIYDLNARMSMPMAPMEYHHD